MILGINNILKFTWVPLHGMSHDLIPPGKPPKTEGQTTGDSKGRIRGRRTYRQGPTNSGERRARSFAARRMREAGICWEELGLGNRAPARGQRRERISEVPGQWNRR